MINFTTAASAAYPVMEIFSSIQGEGSLMGFSCTFIRLAGCNLKCPWCDTKESWDAGEYKKLTIDEILVHVKRDYVVITGGEPLLYDISWLVMALKNEGKRVGIETNGTIELPKEWLPYQLPDFIACSPKPPEYKLTLSCFQELKYVVDKDFTFECIPETLSDSDCPVTIWLQPEGSHMRQSMSKIIGIINEHPNANIRAGIQLHKIMEVK